MQLEMLVSAVDTVPSELISHMKPEGDVVLINQCNRDGEESFMTDRCSVRVFSCNERGVGKSRNLALSHSKGDIILFSDDDIVYRPGYGEAVLEEFQNHPEADILLFNVEVCPERKTYWNQGFFRVKWYNCGRYPAYSIAARREKLLAKKVIYSELFGGGAKYSNGEDSLFLKQCADAGMALYATDVIIGMEEPGESTWFFGYTEKFFYDRGVLFAFLYGRLAWLWALRFVLTKKEMFRGEIKRKQAYHLIREGIKQGKLEKRKQ